MYCIKHLCTCNIWMYQQYQQAPNMSHTVTMPPQGATGELGGSSQVWKLPMVDPPPALGLLQDGIVVNHYDYHIWSLSFFGGMPMVILCYTISVLSNLKSQHISGFRCFGRLQHIRIQLGQRRARQNTSLLPQLADVETGVGLSGNTQQKWDNTLETGQR